MGPGAPDTFSGQAHGKGSPRSQVCGAGASRHVVRHRRKLVAAARTQARWYGCKRGGLRLPAPRPHKPRVLSRAYAAARIAPLCFCGFCGSPHASAGHSIQRSHRGHSMVETRRED